MRFSRFALVAGGGLLLVAGAAEAAEIAYHRLDVDLPDGGVAHIDYAGNVAPRVTFDDSASQFDDEGDDDAPLPFLDLARFDAFMDAQQAEMMRQVSELQKVAETSAGADRPGAVLASDLPAGARFTMISSETDAKGCTRTVEYRSDGSGTAPKMTKTSAGSCDDARADARNPVQVKATSATPADSVAEVGRKV